jgi:hypothetical protein
MTDSIQLNYVDANGAIVASPVFYLDAASVEIDDAASIENFEIPGMPWNIWFNNNNVTRRWVISGTFRATDVTWDSATSQGRPLDFEHQLSCFLDGIDASTGALLPASADGFAITIKQVFNGVVYSRATSTDFSVQKIHLMHEKHNIKLVGGSPGVADYTATFVEVEEVVNMGL